MARARPPARRDRGRRPHARAAPHRLPRVRARRRRRGSHADVRFAGASRVRPRRPRPRRRVGARAATTAPPAAAARRRSRRAGRHAPRAPVGEVLDGVLAGEEVGVDEIVTLLGARGPEVVAVAEVADQLRRDIVGDDVTFVRNRNINYTNVCTFKCRFCAFSKGPLSLNLRGDPYLLELEEMQRRVVEAVECGATEVCLQGGIHPDFDGDYYLDVARAVKAVAPADPRARLHRARGHRGRAPARHAARATTCCRLKEAGLATLPGTAAEILDDEVRAIICPDKVNTEEWLEAHRTAHSVGLRSNVTIMFGTRRTADARRAPPRAHPRAAEGDRRLHRVRAAAVRAHGHADLPPAARRGTGPTFREVLLMHAVGRIAYRGWIDNVQVSWVKTGVAGARQVAAGRVQRPRRHADGREHLAGRGRQPRPGARRVGVPRDRRAARPPARAAHHALRPHARPSAAACVRRPTTHRGRRSTVGRASRRPSRSVAVRRVSTRS